MPQKSMEVLPQTIASKSDLRATKTRLEAQWRVNRLRQVHNLRRTFVHFCTTATEARTEFYDRYQADAGIELRLSKQEVVRLFGRQANTFCWTQLIRHLIAHPDLVALPYPTVPLLQPRPSDMLRTLRRTYSGPAFRPAHTQSMPTLPRLRTGA